jgi:hypothetical protein
MNVFSALPHEHVWSTLARSVKWSGLSNESAFTKKLGLGGIRIQPSKGYCQSLTILSKHKDFNSQLISGSSYPLWLLNFDNSELAKNNLHRGHLEQARESQLNLDNRWRYCQACVEEDRSKHGSAYWHNEHNLPFVTHCTRHQDPLLHVPDLNNISKLSMPNRLKPNQIAPVEFTDEFLQWSNFVVGVYNTIKADPTSVAKFRSMVWSKLEPVPDKIYKRRPYFNKLLAEIELQVPESLLRHCFQFYADDKRRKANFLYTTYKRDGVQIRHPVYMLVILYWLNLNGNVIDEAPA